MLGTLYLVATPIGNLEDITLRALRTLKECDVVAAEDTRRTGQLLKHFGISKPMLSCFQFNEARQTRRSLRAAPGETIALVTDAGSPGISDPGERVVRAARAGGLRVESVPGPCALVAALTASGLGTDEFHFIGFLPHKPGRAAQGVGKAGQLQPSTLILYESPYRIERLLGELQEFFPRRPVVVARELTKKFEEYLRGTPAELLGMTSGRSLKGEFVVLIGGSVEGETPASAP